MHFTILGELTDLNTYIKATNSGWWGGNAIKKSDTHTVMRQAQEQKLQPVKTYPVHIQFIWYTKDKRIDPDNTAYCKKGLLDGLVAASVLKDDSRKYIDSFADKFGVDKENPRVEVTITHSI